VGGTVLTSSPGPGLPRGAEVTDVGIIVGDTAAEIEAAVGDGSELGIRATYIRQDQPLGLAHAVLTAEGFLGDDVFVMFLGDNLIEGGITHVVEAFERDRPAAQLLLKQVRGPAIIGAGTVLEDAYVGPFTSIGDGCHLARTEIEYSVVMAGCTVTDIPRIEGSLLGREVTIRPTDRKPAATKFLLGDHSQVEI